MAEFKLGRIRFVYQGQWTTGTPYVVDDVISIGGKTYICVLNHTAASAFETDQTFNPTRWNVVADGSKWRDVWTAATHYDLGDQVKWGGTVYICNTAHTSSTYSNPTYLGLEDNIEDWDVFATTTSWEGAWVTGKRYKVRDLVSYGGTTYLCKTKHISAATAAEGLELDIAKWDIFNQGITYTGPWLDATRYKLNDIVKYGADLWICTTQHTSATSFDNTKFAIFVNGFQFENSWNDTTVYQLGDIVTYGGYTYTALQNHTAKTPSTETAFWQPFTTGFSFQGDWTDSTTYLIGSVVRLGGYTYVANLDNSTQTVTVSGTTISSDGTRPNQITIDEDTNVLVQNLPISFAADIGGLIADTPYYVKTIIDSTHFTVSATLTSGVVGTVFAITGTTTGQSVVATTDASPPFSTYWTRLNSGVKWNASSETYTGISGTNVVGTGTSATFDVVRQGTVYAVTRNAVGSGYAPTNTIKILGTQVGGLSPVNDITITVSSVSGGQISTITSTGISVTWSTGLTYVLGDVVFYGASSYICVAAHVAASGNRPDADTSATYWNLMASGSESAVLTTQGDMFYFGQNGAQRLPVGTDGQVLRVSGTAPSWSYYGIINNVVYVAPTGSNTPSDGQGLTIDKPWQSVRYAAKQIEDGYLNTNTRDLLKKNKQFLLKEINNYILNTFKVTVTGSSTTAFATASTAGIYIGMPISFTSTDCGVTIGTTYYVAAANFSSTAFSISTVAGGSVFTLTSPGGANTGAYVYSQSKTERDADYAIEGIIYDISHGGTLQTTTNALAYYSTTNTSAYISGVIAGDITAFASAMTYLSTLVGNVLSNTAPDTNYQTTSGIASNDQAIQIIDLSLTAETGTVATATSLISIIKNGLLAGTSTAIATAIQPNTTISVKTGTYNEVLPIVVPRNTAIVGDELRSTVIQPQTAIANLVNDKPKSIASLNRVKTVLSDIMSNTVVTSSVGHAYVFETLTATSADGTSKLTFATQATAPFVVGQKITVSGVTPTGFNGSKTVTECTTTSVSFAGSTAGPQTIAGVVSNQNTSLPVGSIGSVIASSRVIDNAELMYDIINNGISNVPAFVLPAVTGYNTSFLAGFGDGKAQVVQNYAFIKDEVSSYLNTNYNGVWTALGAGGQANCQRDIGYILDALQYDMSYGGNVQTLIVGSSYYSNFALTIGAYEKTATIAAYGWLKAFIDNVIIADTAGWTKNTASTQVTSGTAGSAGAGAFAQDRIQDIIDWITNGTAPITVLPTAAISLTSTSLQTAFSSLQASRTEIQADTTAWVKKFFQSMPFIESTCYRDAGLIVDALSYDLIFGSNFNSITVGRSYARATTSALVVINSQKAAELGAINFIKYKAKHLAAGGGLAMATNAITDITKFITGGAVPRSYWPDFSSINANTAAAAKIIWTNKAFIQAEVIQYITTNYPAVVYSQEICSRDIAYIVDALRYDLTYGGKFASKQSGISYYSRLTNAFGIAAAEKAATLAAYGQLKTIVQALAQGAVYSTLQGSVARVTGTAGSATEATAVGALVDVITNVIDNGLTTGVPRVTITAIATNNTFTAGTHGLSAGDEVIPQSTANGLASGTTYYVISAGLTSTQFRLAATWGGVAIATFTNGAGLTIAAEISNLPAYSWVDSDIQTQQITLSGAKATIQAAVISYINTNYPALTYNNATCSRDVGYIIDAIGYDFMMNSNFRSIKAGMSYYQAQAALVVASQKAATIAAFNYLKIQIASQLANNATALASANSNMDVIINILDKGIGETPEVHGSITYNNTLGTIKAAEILRANKTFLAYEAAAYITASYGGMVTTTTITGDLFTTSESHNFVAGDPVVFSGTTYTGSGVVVGTTYYVLAAGLTSTEFSVSATSGGSAIDVTTDNSAGTTLFVRYSYALANCLRDTTTFVEAIVYDLEYAGTYKSLRAATLYNNAVTGSTTSDMFLIRNGTGLRNCTLSGLVGTLTNPNQYGTKRPTAGAFVALDPGFGPNDRNVWILSRSHYSQNVTMFGTGCSGAKIDAALHTGGNKSMVKNDFTTIISDGIGVWVTGAGSLTELVSVFNYYGYSGYLAELGGRIRATNGNSSYGTYGVIAEGVDTFETPIYATVNNRGNQAQITTVVTDAANKILRFEYGNAGQGYTNSVPSISGSGYNATAIQDEFRDAAVFETRLVDLNDSNGIGGTSYVTSSNTSQGGAAGYITIAATDAALSNAYPGMRIQITAGTGVGQYANILTYNNGTKVANIYKDSFTTLTITATSNGSPSTVTVASTGTLYANMPFYVGTTVGGLTAGTVYYVKTIIGGTTFSVSSTPGGTAFTSEITTTTGQSVALYAAGWDHVIPGFTVTNGIDLTSTYIIEPRISYTAPGYTATTRTMSATATWSSATYGAGNFVAIANGSSSTSYSTDGKTWSSAGALPSTTFGEVVYGGGEGAVATAIVGGLGGSGAQLTAVIGTGTLATQIVSVTVDNGGFGYTTAPTIVFTSASGSGATATCTVLNGAIAGITMTINGSGYLTVPTVIAATDRITGFTINSWGKNYFSTPTVTISGGGSSNQATGAAVLTNAGVSSITVGNTGGSGYTSQPTVTILDTSARYLAISTSATNSAYQTVAGLTSPSAWTAASSTAKTNLYSLTYGGGTFVAVGGASGTATCVQTTDGGTTWNDRSSVITALVSGYYSTVTYGAGTFVAINNGALVTSYSANGVTWTAGGSLPSGVTTTVSSAYGNGRFVTLGSDGKVAYSTDLGLTWTASPTCTGTTTSVLSSSYTWTRIKYGQGLFTAIATGSVAATSPDGINWTTRGMSASSSWQALAFGNPDNKPIWIAASNTSSTTGTSIVTGATALGRVKVAGGSVTEIRMTEPGSNYPAGTVSSIGASNVINVDNTTNLVDLQPITFVGTNAGGITTGIQYFVIGSTIVSDTSFKVASSLVNAGLGTAITLTASTVSGMSWFAGPIATQTDPNKVKTAATHVRAGNGALGNPSFNNRGLNNTTATASTQGDGFSDLYQPSTFINLSGLYNMPQAGANVEFASIPGVWFKLVTVSNILGTPGNYTATFQINPSLSALNAPPHNDAVTTRLKYSQVRLTGHDFLYIGTGGKERTNYPFVDATLAIQSNQSNSSGGGRVFFTSTDQDGNFNVGNLFGVQQATGTATLNASAFNLSGLQSLQLGAVTLGIGSAIVTQFSTDPYFTANSDNVVPTQKAIKSYITAQIGGGSSSLNVNTLTSGVLYLANNTISTTSGIQIKVTSKMNFVGGIDGAPVALGFFMQK